MKIRNGFVSNSSSSSFVCDVCGEIESGWDMCFSEAEMVECEGCGRAYHEEHEKKLTDEEKIEVLSKYMFGQVKKDVANYQKYLDKALKDPSTQNNHAIISQRTLWLSASKDKLKELEEFLKSEEAKNADEVEEYWQEEFEEWRYQYPAEFCPVCSLDAIPGDDSVAYLMKKFNISKKDLEDEIRSRFKTRKELMEYCKGE